MKAIVLTFSLLLYSGVGVSQENAATSEASPSAAVKSGYVICRNVKVVRTIRVDTSGEKCKAIYSKEGKEEIVAKSGTDEKCFEVAHQIRTNLEKSVWKCKDVEADRVSFTLE
ncbi:MAG: hypothetical protein ACK5P7_01675 [Bdellovibrio sp.]|jgi:hypothetical protein